MEGHLELPIIFVLDIIRISCSRLLHSNINSLTTKHSFYTNQYELFIINCKIKIYDFTS